MSSNKGLKTVLEELKNGEDRIEEFVEIAKRSTIENCKDVKSILEDAISFFSSSDNKLGQAWAMATLGWNYNYSGLFEKHVEYERNAAELFTEINDKKGLVYTYNGLMAGYFQLGLNTLSVKYGVDGLKLAEEINYVQYIVTILVNLSINYVKMGRFEEAKENIEEIVAMPYINNKTGILVTINQVMAEVQCEIGDLNKALEYANNAMNLASENDFEILLQEAYRVRGLIYGKLGDMAKAESDFENSLLLTKKGNYQDGEAWVLLSWAQVYSKNGDYNSAINNLLRALQLGKEKNLLVVIRNIYSELYNVYKAVDNYERALFYYEKYINLEKDIESKGDKLDKIGLENEAKKQTASIFKSLYDDIKLISRIGKKITADLNINNILENINSEISLLLEQDVIGITQLNESTGILDYNLYLENGKKLGSLGECNLDDDESIGAYCIKNRCNLLIGNIWEEYSNYVKDELFDYPFPKVHSMIYCPLILEDKVLGFLTVQSYNKYAYTDKDLYMVSVLASYVAIAIDNSYLYNQTKYFATHDYLTGLLSRKEIFTKGEKLYDTCVKEKSSLTFMMIDIDNFKLVNDNYGHAVGDEAIKAIGGIIKSRVINRGISGRYGGEEFLIIIPDIGEEKSYIIGEKIRRAMETSKINIGNNKIINISGSIGMFISYGRENGIDQCISFADEALYIAKAEGRNKIVKYENFA